MESTLHRPPCSKVSPNKDDSDESSDFSSENDENRLTDSDHNESDYQEKVINVSKLKNNHSETEKSIYACIYKTIEGIANSRRPNYHLSYELNNFLNKLSLDFENCSTDKDFFKIEKMYKDAVKIAKKKNLHHLRLHLKYHQLKSSFMRGKIDLSIERKNKLIKFHKTYCTNEPLYSIIAHQLDCFHSMTVKALDFSTFENLQKMCAQLGMLKFGFETHILQFTIGRVLLELLKIPKEIMQLFETFVFEATEKFISTFRPFLERHCNFQFSEDKHVYTMAECINIMRSIAFGTFRIAREGVISGISTYDVNYFYQDPTVSVHCLILMAKMKLDLPEFSSGQSRYEITDDDISEAKKCIDQARAEIKNIQPPSNLIVLRLCISEAGLNFRQYQKLLQHKSDKDIKSRLDYLEKSKQHLDSVKKIIERMPLDDGNTGRKFKECIEKCIKNECHNFKKKYGYKYTNDNEDDQISDNISGYSDSYDSIDNLD